METYYPGEIVLLSFPFTDAAEARRRPALVLLDTGDEDIVVARVTSQTTRDSLDVRIVEWQEAGLLLPSTVRVHKLATLEKRMVERKLGALTPNDWAKVRLSVRHLWRDF